MSCLIMESNWQRHRITAAAWTSRAAHLEWRPIKPRAWPRQNRFFYFVSTARALRALPQPPKPLSRSKRRASIVQSRLKAGPPVAPSCITLRGRKERSDAEIAIHAQAVTCIAEIHCSPFERVSRLVGHMRLAFCICCRWS